MALLHNVYAVSAVLFTFIGLGTIWFLLTQDIDKHFYKDDAATTTGEKTVTGNSIMTIHPYWNIGVWAFDDKAAKLQAEPFVGEINDMIDYMVRHIPTAQDGFALMFSATPFPGAQLKLDKTQSPHKKSSQWGKYFQHFIEDEYGDPKWIGTWYRSDELQLTGWLCPALFKYFQEAPETIYARALPLPPGVKLKKSISKNFYVVGA